MISSANREVEEIARVATESLKDVRMIADLSWTIQIYRIQTRSPEGSLSWLSDNTP